MVRVWWLQASLSFCGGGGCHQYFAGTVAAHARTPRRTRQMNDPMSLVQPRSDRAEPHTHPRTPAPRGSGSRPGAVPESCSRAFAALFTAQSMQQTPRRSKRRHDTAQQATAPPKRGRISKPSRAAPGEESSAEGAVPPVRCRQRAPTGVVPCVHAYCMAACMLPPATPAAVLLRCVAASSQGRKQEQPQVQAHRHGACSNQHAAAALLAAAAQRRHAPAGHAAVWLPGCRQDDTAKAHPQQPRGPQGACDGMHAPARSL